MNMNQTISMILCSPFIIAGYLFGWAMQGLKMGIVLYDQIGRG